MSETVCGDLEHKLNYIKEKTSRDQFVRLGSPCGNYRQWRKYMIDNYLDLIAIERTTDDSEWRIERRIQISERPKMNIPCFDLFFGPFGCEGDVSNVSCCMFLHELPDKDRHMLPNIRNHEEYLHYYNIPCHPVCHFMSSPTGCKNGEYCEFSHLRPSLYLSRFHERNKNNPYYHYQDSLYIRTPIYVAPPVTDDNVPYPFLNHAVPETDEYTDEQVDMDYNIPCNIYKTPESPTGSIYCSDDDDDGDDALPPCPGSTNFMKLTDYSEKQKAIEYWAKVDKEYDAIHPSSPKERGSGDSFPAGGIHVSDVEHAYGFRYNYKYT